MDTIPSDLCFSMFIFCRKTGGYTTKERNESRKHRLRDRGHQQPRNKLAWAAAVQWTLVGNPWLPIVATLFHNVPKHQLTVYLWMLTDCGYYALISWFVFSWYSQFIPLPPSTLLINQAQCVFPTWCRFISETFWRPPIRQTSWYRDVELHRGKKKMLS